MRVLAVEWEERKSITSVSMLSHTRTTLRVGNFPLISSAAIFHGKILHHPFIKRLYRTTIGRKVESFRRGAESAGDNYLVLARWKPLDERSVWSSNLIDAEKRPKAPQVFIRFSFRKTLASNPERVENSFGVEATAASAMNNIPKTTTQEVREHQNTQRHVYSVLDEL